MALRNVFACLVHEAPDCVEDLVRNLRCLDPASEVVLYDGSEHGRLLDGVDLPAEHVQVHPRPRPMQWGRLHGFALDCMRHALAELPFDAMTIVDSDQLLIRPGYSQRLAEVLAEEPATGCLINAESTRPRALGGPLGEAWQERRAWSRYLCRFPDGEELFPQWSFWPSTVFTAEGARRLLALWDDPELTRLVADTGVSATEEVVLPTLVALSGAGVRPSPFRRDCLQFRRTYAPAELERVARLDDAFWLHPAPRALDDPVRAWVRDRYAGYRYRSSAGRASPSTATATPLVSCLLAAGDDRRRTEAAVRAFQRQSYPDRELVLLDDGDHPVEELVADVPRVTYLRPAARRSPTLGRAVTRLVDQVRALVDDAADVCGLRTVHYYDASQRCAWRYSYPRDRRPWLAEPTLCYRRELWEDCPFPETAPPWQAGFFWASRARRLTALDEATWYVAMLPLDVAPEADRPGTWWTSVPVDAVDRLLGDDRPWFEPAVAPTQGGARS
jgi:hypothetical protein